jgi:hypothetical protein
VSNALNALKNRPRSLTSISLNRLNKPELFLGSEPLKAGGIRC